MTQPQSRHSLFTCLPSGWIVLLTAFRKHTHVKDMQEYVVDGKLSTIVTLAHQYTRTHKLMGMLREQKWLNKTAYLIGFKQIQTGAHISGRQSFHHFAIEEKRNKVSLFSISFSIADTASVLEEFCG